MNTKEKGDITVAYIIARCLEIGWSVLTPIGDIKPYDIVINRGNGFERVQVKHARCVQGCLVADISRIRLTNSQYNAKNGIRRTHYTKNDIDLFALLNIKEKKMYLVPFKEASIGQIRLRIDQPKKCGNKKNIKWAKNYEI